MTTIVLDSLNFVSQGVTNGISLFREVSAGVVGYFKTLTNSVSLSKQRTNVKWKLVIPFPVAPSESCPCPGEAPYLDTIVDFNVRMDPRADAAYRTNVQEMATDLAAPAPFKASITGPTLAQ